MPKVKPKKSVPLIDMTAMVDVAFLLLTFFILATSFKAPEATQIKTPSSVNDTTAPNEHAMLISIDSAGRVYVGYSDFSTREKVLQAIEEQYKFTASEKGRDFFRLQAEFGMAFADMPAALAGNEEQVKEATKGMGGIPFPFLPGKSQENELKRWIVFGVTADPAVSKNVGVKADQNTPIEAVQNVFNTLQEWNINRFNLITDKEEAPSDMVVKEKKADGKSKGKSKEGDKK